MKNFLLISIFIFGVLYYFVPHNTKVYVLERVGIDSSFLGEEVEEVVVDNGEPITLKFDKKNEIKYEGNISHGEVMELSWASLPFVKCFYPKDYNSFDGNVVLHRFYLPKNKNVEIKLTQEFIDKKLSMYVYKTEAVSKVFPPEKTSVYDCKKNMEITLGKSIQMNGNTAPSDIIIGITGMKGLLEGGYTLEVVKK